MKKYSIFLLLCCFLAGIAGCSDSHVSGTVTFSDGTPLHVGMVILQNEKDQGIGQIDEKGHFTMYQFKPGDGLKPGVYRGYITNADELDQKGNPVSVINLKYTDIEQSGIIYDSSKDNGTLNIVVEKAAPPKK